MLNQINETKNSQRNKISAIAQIHCIQAHISRNQIREEEEGENELALKPRRQQTLILMNLYIIKLFKF